MRFTRAKGAAIDRFQSWLDQGKLIGIEKERLRELLELRSQQLADTNPSIVLLADSDPAAFSGRIHRCFGCGLFVSAGQSELGDRRVAAGVLG